MNTFIKGMSAKIVCIALAVVMFAGGLSVLSRNVVATDGLVPVSDGAAVTIWEQTTQVRLYAFTIGQLSASGGVIFTTSGHETYYVSTDGTYLTIKCNRWWSPYPPPKDPMSTGNNICGVLLSGVTGYPSGLWARQVVDYQLGDYGAADSLVNALGPWNQPGPYRGIMATVLGDGWSQFTVAFLTPESLPAPPVANAGPDQTVSVGTSVTLDGSASTATADCGFVWTYPGQTSSLLGKVQQSVFNNAVTIVTLWAIDSYGQASTDTMTVNLILPPPPVAEAGPDVTILAGTLATLDGTGSANANDCAFEWWFTNAWGNWVLLTGPVVSYHFTVDTVVELTVYNLYNQSSTDTMTVHVLYPPPPVADAGPDQIAMPGEYVMFHGEGSSASPECHYTWSFYDPAVGNVWLGGVNAGYYFSVGGTYTVTLTVFDPYSQSSTDTMTVNIHSYMGTVYKDWTKSMTFMESPAVNSNYMLKIWNVGLRSMTIVVSDLTVPSKAVTIKVSFSALSAYPSGIIDLKPVTMLAGHTYSVTIKDLDGPRGGWADILRLIMPA